ncbi:aminodeoxychorismate synthase component I [Marinigracilibium pacificum]|uniref:Aminodeoxychorismate synthase component I n=1 Tax=Marinigracilibium pacificum TaxID=2729599 RepID=A0A848IZI0_9BACT|nr:aminodeoxychorismate synthase component I [Marinigracilibium pacificum]NMM48695.1 aminodeoxychorismate synthase component I [Marinigracilibium pacificum]
MEAINQTIQTMNKLGSLHTPFFFIVDFEHENPLCIPLKNLDSNEIAFNFNGFKNVEKLSGFNSAPLAFNFNPVTYEEFNRAFDIVYNEIHQGNSYLLNLTFRSEIESNFSLEEIIERAKAKYKIWWKNKFISFSPETFIQINNNTMHSFPMKGTRVMNSDSDKELLLNDHKESAEHVTIVDLIRNDMSILGKKVEVTKFKYLDTLETHKGKLLQMSSQISTPMEDNWHKSIGSIIFSMLPAGSISGAPKKKTIEIIKAAEQRPRGFYTGVAGIYDGKNFDSCVLIRYIEKDSRGKLYFRSGGGITHLSNPESEYQEVLNKIYVPVY